MSTSTFSFERDTRVQHGPVVWKAKPWILPLAIVRTIVVFAVAILVLWAELYFGAAMNFFGLGLFALTLIVFLVVWLLSLLHLLILWASNTYILRQDGLEVRRGIVTLRSFVVTPAGFSDLEVFQSIGGRILGYGAITVYSQGERKTCMILVRAPFVTADRVRDVMGKPIVRVEGHV